MYLKKLETITNNPSIMIYINKVENRITFKIKAGYYLELLLLETMKLLEIKFGFHLALAWVN